MGSRRCSVWLPTRGRARVPGDRGRQRVRTLQGRALAPSSSRGARAGASRSSSARARPRSLAARSMPASSRHRTPSRSSRSRRSRSRRKLDVAARELELLAGIASQARLAITNAGSFATSSGRSSRPSRRSRTRSRRRTLHVLAHALDLRHGDRGRERARPRRAAPQAARARRPVPRHRQDRDPCVDPHEARAADRRGALADRAPPELGERILAPIDQLAEVRPIVRACHERYDGAGYLDRLAGDEIPSRRGSSSPATPSTR